MKKKIIIPLVFSVVCVVLFVAARTVADTVCVQNLVSVNGKAKQTGIYLCFDGGRIDKAVDEYGWFYSREKSILELMMLAGDPDTIILENKVDLSGIDSDKASAYIKAINDMWGEVESKRFLFYADHDELRKFVLSGVYKGERLLLQAEITQEDNRLRVIRSNNTFSKLLAHWHVYASQFPDDELQLSFLDRLVVLFKYNKLCPDDNYCVFYKRFNFSDQEGNALGVKVWGEFLSRLTSGKVSELLHAMDSGSMKNIGLGPQMTEVPKPVESMVEWLREKRPIAFLYGDRFLIAFVADNAQKESTKVSYSRGGAIPIYFYEDDETREYMAIELNKINVMHEFFRQADFSGENNRSPNL